MAKDPKKTNQNDEPLKVQVVDTPPEVGATTAGPALSAAQRAGLEPVDHERDNEENENRREMTNLQTTHEAENTLDGVSGTPSPGITAATPLTGLQQGQDPSDMSGRPPLQQGDRDVLPRIRDALRNAKRDDKQKGLKDHEQGWRNALELGSSGAQMRRILDSGAPLETQTIPNGHFFPDTGTRYRIK